MGSEPGEEDCAGVDDQKHYRSVECKDALGLDGEGVDLPGGLSELLLLEVLPDECLDHTDSGHVLLDAGVELIVLLEHLPEDWHNQTHDAEEPDCQHHKRG